MAPPHHQGRWSSSLLLLALLAAWPAGARAAAAAAAISAAGGDHVSTSLAIINGFLVFFMQVGFLAFETGSGRAKNVRNILLKNLLDVMLAALVWWAVGYAFAYGSSAGGVIGTSNFFYEGGSLSDPSTRPWFFSWTFAIAAATIISGSLAERTCLLAYPAATLLIVGLVHPLLVHAIWSPDGWLSRLGSCQVLDFAGGLVVHMLGGLFGLLGAWKAGPRLGRFEVREPDDDDDGDDDDGGDGGGEQQQCGDEQQQHQRQVAGGPAGPVLDSARELLAHPAPPWQQQQQQGQAGQAGPLPAGALELQGLNARAAAAASAAAAAGGSGAAFPGWPGGARQVMPTAGSGSPGAAAAAAAAAADELDGAQPDGPAAGAAALPAQLPAARAGGRHSSSPGWRSRLGLWDGSKPGAGGGGGGGLCRCSRQRRRRRLVAKPMPGHDMALVTLGTFMLWFGWYGFNSGSVYVYLSNSPPPGQGDVLAELVTRASMNTSLGGAAGGLAALLVAALFSGTYDLRVCCNGVLSGLVTVTCMCGFVDPWAAVLAASIAGAAYPAVSAGLLAAGIDDPLDASAVHLSNGLLGSLLLAFVAKPDHVAALTGSTCGGIFYSQSGWQQLGLQLLGVAVVAVLAGGTALALFSVLAHFKLLRVDTATELAGIDAMDHGGPAFELYGSGAHHPAVAGRRLMA